jgi:hypothetical protein
MGEKISLNQELNIILIYKTEKHTWEDKSSSINALFSSYYYGKFTGYDVYFKGANQKFFYPSDRIKILNYSKDIEVNDKDIFVDNLYIEPLKIQSFEHGYYKVITKNKVIVTNNMSFKDSLNKNTFLYFKDLSKYAGLISNLDEPLYFLSIIIPKKP